MPTRGSSPSGQKSFADFLTPGDWVGRMSSLSLHFNKVTTSYYTENINQALEDLCKFYLRPDKLEDYLRGNISYNEARWDLNDLLTEAAGGNPNDVVWGFPESYYGDQWPAGKFYPETYLPWLTQRYEAVKLLRYLELEGYSHFQMDGFRGQWGYGSTPDAAVANAEENGWEFFNEPGVGFPYLSYTRRTWDEAVDKYHDCNLRNITKCYLLPGYKHFNVMPPAFLEVIVSDQDYDRPAPGVPGPGHHLFTADEDGVFFGYETPFWQGMTFPELPDANDTVQFGPEFIDELHGHADYGALFRFSSEDTPQPSATE